MTMAEKEYIEREALMNEIYRIGGHNLCEWSTIGVKALVGRQPTADVVEVRHGEWVYPPYAPYGGSYQMRHCSLCEYSPPYIEDIIYEPYSHYCPNCGAKMDGKGDTQ